MNKLQKTILAASLAIMILVATIAPAAARKVNEYEGQHIVAPSDPGQ